MTRDDQRLQDDITARANALDITRSFIIQAPAGSGKTELLIQRYLSLLAEVEHPEEIIAITFTRKAAAEMQLRIVEALRRAASGIVPSEDHERKTFELATAALQRATSQDWNIIGNSRRLRILTLDALNASIVRSQPMTSGVPNAQVVVGADLLAVHREAAISTLDWLTENDELRAATVEVLRHVDNNIGLYENYLSQMLATRDQWLPFIGSGLLTEAEARRLRERFENSLRMAVTDQLAKTRANIERGDYADLVDLLERAARNLVDAGNDSERITALSGCDELPGTDSQHLAGWQGIAELLLTQKGQFRKRVDKRQGFPTTDKAQKAAMQSLLSTLRDDDELADNLFHVTMLPPSRYDDQQWQVLLALFRLLPIAVAELKRLFAERNVTDHVEVALAANIALGTPENPGDIALLLDYQVRHLLVDEMQDTSAAQYRMLETLVGGWQAGDGRSLCCVGDPMQSIYRFRNAEVGQFLLAREFGIGQIPLEPLTLRRNFRSGERLVDWFNTVFPSVLALRDDALRSAVSYADAVAVPGKKGQGRCEVHPIFGTNPEDEARAGCRLIVATLAKYPEDDMAVLVRGRTQLPQLLANLRSASVPYRAVEIDRLTDLPEIIDVLALTRAAVHPADRIAWLGLLRGPWIGLDWSDLHALVRNDSSSTVWQLINDDERLRQLSSTARSLVETSRNILALLVRPRRVQGLRELIEEVWFALGGPGILDDDSAVENVYRFFDVLARLERAGTVSDVGELETILDMERVSSNDNARLQIMTMHRSKGLQFDHVLLFGLGRQPGQGSRRVLSWFDLPSSDGIEQKVISAVGPRVDVDNDPVHRYIENVESEKDRHEQARLFYVACTRGRKSLHLMGNTAIAKDGEDINPARSDSLLQLIWPNVEDDFRRAFRSSGSVEKSQQAQPWGTPLLRRFESPWCLPRVEPLPDVETGVDSDAANAQVEFYWVGSEARIAGTLVHRWLQLLVEDPTAFSTEKRDAFRVLTRRWLKESGTNDEASRSILSRVEQAVSQTVSDTRGQWLLSGDGHAELALSGVFEDELVSVILDRVRIEDDGTHWIIDYKTSAHEGGNLAGFLQVEVDRYRPQLARYAALYSGWAQKMPRCALYFPLLGEFVEVDV